MSRFPSRSTIVGIGTSVAAFLTLASCAGTQGTTLGALAGTSNVEAMDAAMQCRFDEALALADREAASENPASQLFAQFVRASVYTETGRPGLADRALDEAYTDPAMNPGQRTSRASMQESADGLLEAIQLRREEVTGSPSCPS